MFDIQLFKIRNSRKSVTDFIASKTFSFIRVMGVRNDPQCKYMVRTTSDEHISRTFQGFSRANYSFQGLRFIL